MDLLDQAPKIESAAKEAYEIIREEMNAGAFATTQEHIIFYTILTAHLLAHLQLLCAIESCEAGELPCEKWAEVRKIVHQMARELFSQSVAVN